MIAFGDPFQARVATLGINPSHKEFVEKGRLLSAGERRLATLDSLGAKELDELTDVQAATVVADCAAYFDRRPYRQWFDPFDQLIRQASSASYYERSACHLDLVQWATDPAWGGIVDPQVKRDLLEDGAPHLKAQLAAENLSLLLVNGRSVLDRVAALGLVGMDEVGRIPLGEKSCRLYEGMGRGARWLGWSANLQSSWGISNDFKQQLGGWLADRCAASVLPARALHTDGHLPQRLRVRGKTGLVEVLGEWLKNSRAQTIGDIGTFAGKAWLLIDLDGEEVALNADTKRSAVADVVRGFVPDPEPQWRIVANRRGRFNKVLPGLEPLPGWYAYLRRPRSEAGLI